MSVPVLSVQEMREWETATWRTGVSEDSVIARVGLQIASRISSLVSANMRILVLAGKGNNGNDARLACPHLSAFAVERLEVSDPAKQMSLLRESLERQPDLIVDGLFGIGLNRPLNQKWCRFIELVNKSHAPVLSIDAPSGLNCDTGEPSGACIEAGITLTLGAPKQGLLARTAWPFVGRLEVAPEIGLVKCPADSDIRWTLEADFDRVISRRSASGHKGHFGHLVIIAGSLGFHGAAVLAARAAASAAPGLITVVTTSGAYPSVAAQLQSSMVRPWNSTWPPPDNTTALLLGPGLAGDDVLPALRKRLLSIWRRAEYPVIADATALDWLPQGNRKPAGLRVITPHPGEAGRMLGKSTSKIQNDRVATVRRLSRKLGGALVVLKGHQSIVGDATGPCYFNSTGSPWLAQGGSGDVLAGFIGGLLAQPMVRADPMLAVRYAVWRHGRAAESTEWNGRIDDLPEHMSIRRGVLG